MTARNGSLEGGCVLRRMVSAIGFISLYGPVRERQ
jgi:hypothetical protein